MYTSEYFHPHSIEGLEEQIKRLKRTCMILSVSVTLFALIGIHSALRVRRMLNIVESTTERVCLICDEIEDDLNSQPQYKCDNTVL